MKRHRATPCVLAASLAVMSGAGGAVAQEFPVRGRVTAVDGTALGAAIVRVKGATASCRMATSPDGDYQLAAGSAADTLVFSKVGFVTLRVPVTSVEGQVTANRSVINVTLAPRSNEPRPDPRPGVPAASQVRYMGEPLYLIDGVVADSATFNSLEPGTIEAVSLDRGSVPEQYGEVGRNANGIVHVRLFPEC